MQIKWLLKRVESRLRNLRALISPEAREVYASLLRERLQRSSLGPGPWVWLDINALDFDGPQGRLIYSVFVMFERAGFNIAVRPNRAFLSTFQRRRIKRLLLKRVFPLVEDAAILPPGYWWVTDRPTPGGAAGAAKQVHLLRHGPVPTEPGSYAMPFSLFPPHYESGADHELYRYRDTPKRFRLFFGGASGSAAYDKSSGARLYNKVPRGELINALKQHLGPDRLVVIEDAQMLSRMLEGYFPGAVIMESRKLKVPVAQWLSLLAGSEAFLAAPGVNRPMSHNIIEAMAVGVPPLTEYGEYFHPPLLDRQTCLAYAGLDGFRERLDQVLAMDAASLAQMSQRVARHYDDHLRYDRFIEKLAADPAVCLRLHIAPHEQPVSAQV